MMTTIEKLETMAADLARETGCPVEVARAYLKAFLRCPEAQAAVAAEARLLVAKEGLS